MQKFKLHYIVQIMFKIYLSYATILHKLIFYVLKILSQLWDWFCRNLNCIMLFQIMFKIYPNYETILQKLIFYYVLKILSQLWDWFCRNLNCIMLF